MNRIGLLGIALLAACGGGALEDDTQGVDGGPTVDAMPADDADSGVQPGGALVDPTCTDGLYSETLPDGSADIDDVAFTGDIGAFVDTVLERRYPIGAAVVAGGRTYTSFGQDCDVLFAGSPQSSGQLLARLGTIVHECGHFYDFTLGSGATDGYFIRPDLTLSCTRGDTTTRGGDTFARSLLTGDAYSSLRPPCIDNEPGCDRYAPIYLDGDPANGEFESGDQGFNLLFEEAVQYVNSLATSWAFMDQLANGQRTSARDGILTLLWWIERYLQMARLEYPAAYDRITDECWRDAILTLWGRAWLYLELTADETALGIEDSDILELVTDPDLVSEIQRLRDLEGC